MDIDNGFRTEFFPDTGLQVHRMLVGYVQSHIPRHSHVHLYGMHISDVAGAQVPGQTMQEVILRLRQAIDSFLNSNKD